MRRDLLLLCFVAGSALPAGAAQEPDLRALALEQAAAETTRLLEGFLHETGIPGAVFGLSVGGEVLYEAAFGWADRERRIPATPSTRFRIASISKSLTATVLARLHEEGVLDLDAPIQEHLPDFPDKGAPLSARMLAGHLGGIRHNRQEEVWNTDQPHYPRLADALTLFADDPPLAAPGSAFSYSTPGYTLLGAVMEAAAGVDYRALMRRTLFDPLGMHATLAEDPRETIPDCTAFYVLRDGVIQRSPYMDHSYKLPAGGYLSTARDLLAFGSALCQPGFLSAETLDMVTTSMRIEDGRETGYGFGWNLVPDYDGRRTFGHGGNQPGARTQLVIWPDHGVVASFLCNVRGAPMGDDELWSLATPFMEALERPQAWSAPPARELAGEYALIGLDRDIRAPVHLVLERTRPQLSGWVRGPELRSQRIIAGRISGERMRCVAVSPSTVLGLELAFDGERVVGRMLEGDDVIPLRGVRQPSLAEVRALLDGERRGEAQRMLEELLERDLPQGQAWYGLASLHFRAKAFEAAADVMGRAAAAGFDPAGCLVDAARAWCRAGDRGMALISLEEALDAGFDDLERLTRLPEFQGLRGQERFEALFE